MAVPFVLSATPVFFLLSFFLNFFVVFLLFFFFFHIFDTTSGVPGVILFRIAFSEPPQTTEELCTYVLKRNATAEP